MRLPAPALFWTVATAASLSAACPELSRFDNFKHAEIGDIALFRAGGTSSTVVAFSSQMQVNTDGAPDSYHPDNIGITHICNGVSIGFGGKPCVWKPDCLTEFNQAKGQGFTGDPKICFFAMVAKDGKPAVQGQGDPKPGFYVSTTALKNPGKNVDKPEGQLDSNTVPFIVIPGKWNKKFHNIGLGDVAVVYRKSNAKTEFAVIGDAGPGNKLGEGSVALHQTLGNDPFIVKSGVRRAGKGIGSRDVMYVIFPGSRTSMTAFTPAAIRTKGKELLGNFGGEQQLKNCADVVR